MYAVVTSAAAFRRVSFTASVLSRKESVRVNQCSELRCGEEEEEEEREEESLQLVQSVCPVLSAMTVSDSGGARLQDWTELPTINTDVGGV